MSLTASSASGGANSLRVRELLDSIEVLKRRIQMVLEGMSDPEVDQLYEPARQFSMTVYNELKRRGG